MSDFEFVFSLFGLLLGLSLAEVLGGFGRALKARHRVRLGWLTPLLGLLVMLDLTSFWSAAWSLRDVLPVKYSILMLLLIFTGVYYLAASMVFPCDHEESPDYDAHYWDNKRLIVASIFGLNLPHYTIDWLRGGVFVESSFGVIVATVFMVGLGGLWFARGRAANTILLAFLIALYPLGSLIEMLA